MNALKKIASMDKSAIFGLAPELLTQGVGTLAGYATGRVQYARGKDRDSVDTVDAKNIIGTVLIPGGLGYQYGKRRGYDDAWTTATIKKEQKKKKKK